MLSSLPKLADRNFIIGFFVPALLAALVVLWLFRDSDGVQQVYEAVWKEKKWEEITVFALGVWVFSVVLMLVNHFVYRMVEGYTAPMAWLGNSRLSKRRETLSQERQKLISEVDGTTVEQVKDRLNKRIDAIDLILANDFPPLNFPVLPTRFGNAIRAFEAYALVVYGVDSIPAWGRLAALAPKQLASMTADARAEVDFFLNTFILSMVLALIALGQFLCSLSDIYAVWLAHYSRPQWALLSCTALCAVTSWLAYNGAVWRAVAWGECVKTTFDLGLPKLANSLGYKLPKAGKERREFWTAFSLMALYQVPMEPSSFPAASKAPATGSSGGNGDGGAGKDSDGEQDDGDAD
ncbi:hypothetical protein [uncultured Bradyrhizobium sp.]|uniref:hypothetical protein n=1 Tax=Bradyrhizobium sp. TaxID=376 RepID=UPI0026178ABF|nr:hypothetical protein [uncultured Bradyrhizobium sp.]